MAKVGVPAAVSSTSLEAEEGTRAKAASSSATKAAVKPEAKAAVKPEAKAKFKPEEEPEAELEAKPAAKSKVKAAEPVSQGKRPREANDDASLHRTADEASGKKTAATSKPQPPSIKRPTPPREPVADDDSASPAPPPPRKFYPGMKADDPPNRGFKKLPVGAPKCLSKCTVVITGTLDSLLREEAQALIVRAVPRTIACVMPWRCLSLTPYGLSCRTLPSASCTLPLPPRLVVSYNAWWAPTMILQQATRGAQEKYGGRVTGSVSGKTSHLLRGSDDDGNPVTTGKAQKVQVTPSDLVALVVSPPCSHPSGMILSLSVGDEYQDVYGHR